MPFALVAVFGLVGGAVLDIYSSGLALLALGLRVPRWAAAGLDGVLMVLGTIYVVWIAADFITPFQGFQITLGVPISAWCGVFLADLALRRRPYAEHDLHDARGRYGAVNPVAVASMVLGTFLGWGLVVNTLSPVFGWEGYLMDAFGLGPKADGTWTYANIGVLVAISVGFLGQYAFGRGRVRAQETVGSEPAS